MSSSKEVENEFPLSEVELLRMLPELTKTLASLGTFERGFDDRLKLGIVDVISSFNAIGIVATISESGVPFGCMVPKFLTEPTALDAMECLEAVIEGKAKVPRPDTMNRSQKLEVAEDYLAIVLPKDLRRRTETGTIDERFVGRELFGVLFRAGDVTIDRITGDLQPRRLLYSLEVVSDAIMMLLRRRWDIYSRFPKELSSQYWRNSPRTVRPKDKKVEPFVPPWDLDDQPNTVTVSLDLCQSTLAMAESRNLKAFADWSEELGLILRRLTRRNGGVFDKYTGDGVIAHFVARDLAETRMTRRKHSSQNFEDHPSNAVVASVQAAWEMLFAVSLHLEKLRDIVHLWSSNFGARVGVAAGPAKWSVSRNGEPIVVGESVVTACRLTDAAKVNEILISNGVKTDLIEALGVECGVEVRESELEGKGFPKELQLRGYALMGPPPASVCDLDRIRSICDEVYAETDRRLGSFGKEKMGTSFDNHEG